MENKLNAEIINHPFGALYKIPPIFCKSSSILRQLKIKEFTGWSTFPSHFSSNWRQRYENGGLASMSSFLREFFNYFSLTFSHELFA